MMMALRAARKNPKIARSTAADITDQLVAVSLRRLELAGNIFETILLRPVIKGASAA